jgi:serine/threonine protein kinase
MGTPAYMAPEQADDEPLDHRCDLFSLGCVLYRSATGQLPFKGKDSMAIMMALATKRPEPPCEIDPMVPGALSDFIMQLLAKDPDERPRNARVAREVLESIERQLATVPATDPTPPRQRREDDDGDLKPLDDEDVGLKADPEDDVVLLEVDDGVAVEEVEEVVEVIEESRPARPKSGSRAKRRKEDKLEEPSSERTVIIIGAIVAGLIVLLLAFLFLRRAMRSGSETSQERDALPVTARMEAPARYDGATLQSPAAICSRFNI